MANKTEPKKICNVGVRVTPLAKKVSEVMQEVSQQSESDVVTQALYTYAKEWGIDLIEIAESLKEEKE
ncbi:hypothetical protein SAMN02745136_00436 [Anaerocolumna jejuensis DSM 15929]|uniref:Uncharacterized protein n=1 Tax=Anaerocolumna jejuensis DSM 15929 TaxID=1121322 RepID=A0A1M6KFT6_9FIRM|nr:hypothetical protein [Anaerocolumna jejuensis]SHJ57750.1 hypothetical protein SAMN02745136_00436 [Anaerocolumna jejuensis DSM 15929]